MNASTGDDALSLASAQLGVAADADAFAVRQAYARLLKQIDPASDIDAFQTLRRAYELCLCAAQGRTPSARQADSPAQPAPPSAFDALALDRVDSGSLADAALGTLTRHLNDGVAGVADAASALQHVRQGLISLEAGVLFERGVADLLASGWQPGHEFLFEAARNAFGWAEDRSRLSALGDAGVVLREACIEEQAFCRQAPDLRHRPTRLVRRLRNPSPPSPTLLRDELPLLKMLVRRYPHWLHVVTPMAHIEQWLGGPQALQTQLATTEPLQHEAPAERRLSDWQIIGFLAWLAFMAWHHFG